MKRPCSRHPSHSAAQRCVQTRGRRRVRLAAMYTLHRIVELAGGTVSPCKSAAPVLILALLTVVSVACSRSGEQPAPASVECSRDDWQDEPNPSTVPTSAIVLPNRAPTATPIVALPPKGIKTTKVLRDAARDGNIEAVKALVAAGARVNVMYEGRSHLHEAAAGGHAEVVQALLDAGAHADVKAEPGGETPLSRAAAEGYPGVVRILLDAGADANRPGGFHNRTPIYQAVASGNVEVVQVLIDAGADVNAQAESGIAGYQGNSLLHKAAAGNHLDVVRLLLNAGADVNSSGGGRETPLHHAARGASAELVNVLIDAGADIHGSTDSKETPMHWAASNGNAEMTQALIDVGVEFSAWDYSLLKKVIYGDGAILGNSSGSAKVLQILIDNDLDVSRMKDNGGTPLHWASRHGNAEMAKNLISAGVDVNAMNSRGETTLHSVGYWSNAEFAQALIEAGADVNAKDEDGRTPLHRAAIESIGIDQTRTMQLLIESGADIQQRDRNEESPLHAAVRLPRLNGLHWHGEEGRKSLQRALSKHEAVGVLLSANAAVDARNNEGQMPLHIAAAMRDVESTYLLIDSGADIRARTRDGATPMHIAIASMHDTGPMSAIFEALICAGADINARDNKGQTPLHRAMFRPAPRYGNAVQFLSKFIEAGADVNALDRRGQTPLHYAAQGGYIAWSRANARTDAAHMQHAFEVQSEFITTLIAAGADIDAKDYSGNTPIEIAVAYGYPVLVDVFQ